MDGNGIITVFLNSC